MSVDDGCWIDTDTSGNILRVSGEAAALLRVSTCEHGLLLPGFFAERSGSLASMQAAVATTGPIHFEGTLIPKNGRAVLVSIAIAHRVRSETLRWTLQKVTSRSKEPQTPEAQPRPRSHRGRTGSRSLPEHKDVEPSAPAAPSSGLLERRALTIEDGDILLVREPAGGRQGVSEPFLWQYSLIVQGAQRQDNQRFDSYELADAEGREAAASRHVRLFNSGDAGLTLLKDDRSAVVPSHRS